MAQHTTSANSKEYDIIIIGGGMVGMTLACLLSKIEQTKSMRIAIVEAQALDLKVAEPIYCGTEFDARVSALNSASQSLLQAIGAWPAVHGMRVCPYDYMSVWDAEGTGSISFDANEVGRPCLGHIVENSVIACALRKTLSGLDNMSVLSSHKVVDVELNIAEDVFTADSCNGIILNDGQRLLGRLVVAADGALSATRQLAGFSMREWDYNHNAIVTTVKTELPHRFTAWQRFLPEGPLAFLPLIEANDCDNRTHSHYSSIVWSAQTQYAENLMRLDDDGFMLSLAAAFEHRLGRVEQVAKRFTFPLRQRYAKSYFRPGLVLVGDAAHTIHPLAGQGVNLGFADAKVLAEEIERALQRSIPLAHQSILRRYQRRRMAKNMTAMGVMEGFKRLFEQTELPIRWLRNEGMRQLDNLTSVKRQLIKQAMGT